MAKGNNMETTCRQFIRKRIGEAISPERWESMMDIEIDQADGITGSFPFPEGTGGGAEGALHFYRASLTVDRALFSDEVDKWSLLSILWQEVARWQYEVVGFTLMDDQLQLVLCKNRDNEEKHTGFESDQKEAVPEGTMIEDLGKSYRDYFVKEKLLDPAVVREHTTWEEIGGRDNIVDACCSIHQLPVRQGYVTDVRDFWWSSYQKYHGKYDWAFLNIMPVLGCLSRKAGVALRAFELRQKDWAGRNEG